MAHSPSDMPSPAEPPPEPALPQGEARGWRPLDDLVAHPRATSDAALRDIVISHRVPAASSAARA